MRVSSKPVRLPIGIAVAVAATAGFALREARAEDASASTVYLWKDTKGNCPAFCDNNQFSCPCRTVESES